MQANIPFILLVLLTISCGNSSQTSQTNNVTAPKGWVTDAEDLFTDDEEKSLDSLIGAYEKETTHEIAIITLDSTLVGGGENDMRDLTLDLANTWGVGKKEKNNGVFIGISKVRRTMHIQNGKGIEKVMSDLQTKKIVDSVFIPHYKKDEYYVGTREGVKAIMEYLRDKKF